MRTIRRIIWHCTATPPGRDVTAAEVRRWHTDPKPVGRGWRDIGYHYLIRLDGTIERGRAEATVGAHVANHNADSIGVAYVGGVAADGRTPKDTRTDAQKATLYRLTSDLLARYPGATVHGHNEYAAKACPSFDAGRDWRAWVATQAPIVRTDDAEPGHDRKSAAASTTVQASAVQAVTAGAGAVTAVAALDGTAQIVALVMAGIVALAAAWILRERLKAWSAGWR